MRRIFSVFFMVMFFFPVGASAQMMGDAAPNTPQWQLSLDVIKAKTQKLMEKNKELMTNYDDLINQSKDLQIQIRDWQMKNEDLKAFLKARRGRSDQQIRIEELNAQINSKKEDVARQQKAFMLLQKQSADMDRVFHLKKLKISDLELHQRQESLKANAQKALQDKSTVAVVQQEIAQLQQKWQEQKDRETVLKKQLDDLKQAQISPVPVPNQEDEIRSLELKVQELTLQKEGLQNKNNVDNNPVNRGHVKELISKKRELEGKIKEYESQLNQFKNPSNLGLVNNSQKKQILRQMIEIDNRNAKLRQKITNLREDILLLRDQVNRLERKVNFTRGAVDKKE